MKISRAWLQNYFADELESAESIAIDLTFHAFEIESVEGDVLDVKVTPNRGHDCLSHRGIAKELSAILDVPMKNDPLCAPIQLRPRCSNISLHIDEPELCARYTAGYIRGVSVGPSPAWLKDALEAIGQKSINNIVDATNYVMFDLGQPLHAFDAGQLAAQDGNFSLAVRCAREKEKMLALDDKEYALSVSNLVIVDNHSGAVVGIAGVKGGKPAGVTEATKDIILESANFDGASVRKTAQALKLRTDASMRFEQVISPELAGRGMRAAADLIVKLAGGEIVGFADEYPAPQSERTVSITVAKVNQILGTALTPDNVADVFRRLGLPFEQKETAFTVTPSFERIDLTLPEDLAEEIARIVGYDKIPAVGLPSLASKPEVNQNFYAAERAREELIAEEYSEVYTSVFADAGERAVANKIGGEHPFLRATLVGGLLGAYERNARNKDLLGLKDVRLFEIGVVWKGGKELTMVGTADASGSREEPLRARAANAYETLPVSALDRYRPFSRYPFIVRDIALWVPADTNADDVLQTVRARAGTLLVRSEKFDEFKKGGKTSYAFRLVFQSFDRTLTDEEANACMEGVYSAVKNEGWEVR